MAAGESAFWQFSLRFYARSGVAPVCLALQDQHGADVNLLFLLLFLSSRQRRLSTAEVRRIDRATAAWRTRAVQPLRALRRDLKNGVEAMDTQATEALRGEIKRCELHAERLQQEMLERTFPAAAIGAQSSIKEAAAANLAAYGAVIAAMSALANGTAGGALPDDKVQTLLGLFTEELAEQRGA